MKLDLTANVCLALQQGNGLVHRDGKLYWKEGDAGSVNRNSIVVVASLRLRTSRRNFDYNGI
jgi:hypothetical protein